MTVKDFARTLLFWVVFVGAVLLASAIQYG